MPVPDVAPRDLIGGFTGFHGPRFPKTSGSTLICPLKEDTFILDFVNDRHEIQEAFKQFYDGAVMGEEVDPQRMYEIKGELDEAGIYLSPEVEGFCEIYFRPMERQSAGDHKLMNAKLDPAADRFNALRETNEEEPVAAVPGDAGRDLAAGT